MALIPVVGSEETLGTLHIVILDLVSSDVSDYYCEHSWLCFWDIELFQFKPVVDFILAIPVKGTAEACIRHREQILVLQSDLILMIYLIPQVKIRVKYLRNPYYDDHFDLKEADHLVGKTLAWASPLVGGLVGRSCEVLGWALYGKWDELEAALDRLRTGKESIAACVVSHKI